MAGYSFWADGIMDELPKQIIDPLCYRTFWLRLPSTALLPNHVTESSFLTTKCPMMKLGNEFCQQGMSCYHVPRSVHSEHTDEHMKVTIQTESGKGASGSVFQVI